MLQAHFVRFYSPGTFMAEITEKPIDNWNVQKAIAMSEGINERYGATPYGFMFLTKGREDHELDSRIINKSGMYYLHGKIKTVEELRAENNSQNRILISNMECNNWKRVVQNTRGYLWTMPLDENDIVLSE